MPVAGEQLSTAMLDYGDCPEAVIFQLENPVGITIRSGIGWNCRGMVAIRISGAYRDGASVTSVMRRCTATETCFALTADDFPVDCNRKNRWAIELAAGSVKDLFVLTSL